MRHEEKRLSILAKLSPFFSSEEVYSTIKAPLIDVSFAHRVSTIKIVSTTIKKLHLSPKFSNLKSAVESP